MQDTDDGEKRLWHVRKRLQNYAHTSPDIVEDKKLWHIKRPFSTPNNQDNDHSQIRGITNEKKLWHLRKRPEKKLHQSNTQGSSLTSDSTKQRHRRDLKDVSRERVKRGGDLLWHPVFQPEFDDQDHEIWHPEKRDNEDWDFFDKPHVDEELSRYRDMYPEKRWPKRSDDLEGTTAESL